MKLVGCIGFSGVLAHPSFFQRAIMFFTNSRWSHSFIVTFEDAGVDTVLEASREVQRVSLDGYRGNPNCIYELYSITGADSIAIDKALSYCEGEYEGTRYGYLQLLYFVWKWFNKKVLGRSIGEDSNWFPDGKICSELVYDYLSKVSPGFEAIAWRYYFAENTVSPQDIYLIVKDHPELFVLAEVNPERIT